MALLKRLKGTKMKEIIVEMAQSNIVILLHGLNRTYRSFSKMESVLKNEGYDVINIDYPSNQYTIEVLVEEFITPIINKYQNQPNTKIHFVTHSMGAILLRYYLQHHKLDNIGNVVMLAPPNQGSEVVDKLNKVIGFKLINGPAGLQLGTKNSSMPIQLEDVDYPVGVIAGNRSMNPILSCLIPGKNDGKVSLKRTKVNGMKDHLVMPYTHTMIMWHRSVIRQTQYFIKNSQFNRRIKQVT